MALQPERLWEIDLARTIAIAMMVAYHSVYDIDLVAPGTGPNPFTGSWGALPEATGSLFLLVAGVALVVSEGRLRRRGLDRAGRFRRHARRAAAIIAAGMVVTLATLVLFPDRFVRFGILHAIGVSLLVATATLRLRHWNIVIGAVIVAAGIGLADERSDLPGGFIIGLGPPGFSSVDYWPLLPWLGVLLTGVGLGSALYPDGTRGRLLARLPRAPGAILALGRLGRHSLPVYLGHQIVLVPLVWLLLLVAGADLAWRP